MAERIDQAFLWLLTTLSALILFFVISDGRLLIAVPAAFFVVVLIRLLLNKLPDRPILCRRKKLSSISHLLKSWALKEENQALCQIKTLLPDLYSESVWPQVQLLQRLPDSVPLSANELLSFLRLHKMQDTLFLLCTGPVSSEAYTLLSEIQKPSVHLTDSSRIVRLLLKTPQSLPALPEAKKRHKPFPVCIARFIHSVRPFRSALYASAFFCMHLLTGSRFYLFSAVLFVIQLTAHFISRLAEARSSSA